MDFNCTCYLFGLQAVHDQHGWLPRHISEYFDGGDENVSLTAFGFWATLIQAGVIGTVLLSRMPVGHTHNACGGEISHVSRHTKGTKKKGGVRTTGASVSSVQAL